MIETKFVQNGIRYNLLVMPQSRREREAQAENIQPDPNLWSTALQKTKLQSGLALPEEIAARNQRAKQKRQRSWRKFYAGKSVAQVSKERPDDSSFHSADGLDCREPVV